MGTAWSKDTIVNAPTTGINFKDDMLEHEKDTTMLNATVPTVLSSYNV